MLDLGVSINVMPLTLYQELKIGPLKPASVEIQLAEKSSVYPKGVVEDVLVKVQDLIFPADFYVLNMGNEQEKKQLMLLGRPFLKTARTLIDCDTGKLTCQFAGETVTFDTYKAGQYPPDLEMVDFVDTSEHLVEAIMPQLVIKDKQDQVVQGVEPDMVYQDKGIAEAIEALKTEEDPEWSTTPLPEVEVTMQPSLITPPKLELKRLPDHLKYIYLGEEDTLPVIISAELTIEEEGRTRALLTKYKKAIGWTLADLKGVSPTVCQHQILLEEDAMPIRDPQRKLNPVMKEVVKKEILKLLEMGMIYPVSDSRWVSPIHVVPKKSGIQVVENDHKELIATRLQTGWRVCIDYRKLNKVTRKDHFPLPFIDQMLERLAGNRYFCFLDGYSGYMQIWVADKDQDKTTFTCPFGTFAYRRMPFGLCNAPGTFQRCMMSIFSDLLEHCIEVFMDDFTVYGKNFNQCIEHLELVLQRCVEKSLVLNYEKCHFMVKEGIVLGHVISEKGIEVDKAKVDIIAKLPYPTNVKQLRGFLGHAGFYRRFVKDFAKIAQPMHRLLQNDVPWEFDEECKEAFQLLKEHLITAPIIRPPEWGMPFELMCDASGYAVGAVL